MSSDEIAQGAPQRLPVERSPQREAGAVDDVVEAVLAVEDEPRLKLGERVGVLDAGRHRRAVLLREEPEGVLVTVSRPFRDDDVTGHLGDRLMLEEQGDLEVQPALARPPAKLDAKDRVAT